jgi:hypothetical protein
MQGFSTDLEALKKNVSDAFEAWETNSHNYVIDDTKLYSINLELMKYIKVREGKSPLDDKGNRQNMASNEINRQNFNKENVDVQDRFKNFQNFLASTMKSPTKLKKKPGVSDNIISNQKELMMENPHHHHPLASGNNTLKKKLIINIIRFYPIGIFL